MNLNNLKAAAQKTAVARKAHKKAAAHERQVLLKLSDKERFKDLVDTSSYSRRSVWAILKKGQDK